MESNQKGTVSKKVFYTTIILLVLLNIGTAYVLYNTDTDKKSVTAQKVSLEKEFKNISDTLDAKRAELTAYMGKNAELDNKIREDQDMIDHEKAQIAEMVRKGNLTAGELAKARHMISKYEASIKDLNDQIAALNTKNEELTNQNTDLTKNLDAERVTTAQLTDQNKGLAKKVELGSLLQINKVDVEAIKKRHSGKEVPVKRAKAAEELKITFETGNNKVLDPGNLDLYVRIINPKGETIAEQDRGSGTIATAESDNPVQYSKKADIDWDQKSKKVIMYWDQHLQDPGTYKVQVYQKGYVVGQGELKLI
ncbi:MAG: hypothetical protein JSS76_09720 [Bacteroidetes bacterium]|nr:hypothetical protein [Bacteroidota bacterium]